MGACTCCAAPATSSARSLPSSDWPGYNGDPGGNRYTTLAQINKANVARLAPKWIFSLPGASVWR